MSDEKILFESMLSALLKSVSVLKRGCRYTLYAISDEQVYVLRFVEQLETEPRDTFD